MAQHDPESARRIGQAMCEYQDDDPGKVKLRRQLARTRGPAFAVALADLREGRRAAGRGRASA